MLTDVFPVIQPTIYLDFVLVLFHLIHLLGILRQVTTWTSSTNSATFEVDHILPLPMYRPDQRLTSGTYPTLAEYRLRPKFKPMKRKLKVIELLINRRLMATC